jgi:pyridoxamine 5'-phosphate oxidase
MLPDLTAIRTEYLRAGLDERDLDPSPSRQVEKWLHDAIEAGHPEPTAMTLATVTPAGEPAARVVLLKGVDVDGIVFYTNYESDKGKQLATNPRACANIFWVLLQRQIRITGKVTKSSRAESEAYFKTRPRESQLGAWASEQSGVLPGRAALEARLVEVRARFGDGEVACPPHWGGYRLSLERVEFWQGRPSRLHDRLLYTRIGETQWRVERLSP